MLVSDNVYEEILNNNSDLENLSRDEIEYMVDAARSYNSTLESLMNADVLTDREMGIIHADALTNVIDNLPTETKEELLKEEIAYLKEVKGLEQALEEGWATIDYSDAIDEDINNNYLLQVGDKYLYHAESSVEEAINEFDRDLDPEEVDYSDELFEAVSGFSSEFENLDQNDKIRVLQYIQDECTLQTREELEEFYFENLSYSYIQSKLEWDEDEIWEDVENNYVEVTDGQYALVNDFALTYNNICENIKNNNFEVCSDKEKATKLLIEHAIFSSAISEELLSDKEFILPLVKKNPDLLAGAGTLNNDKEVVLVALEQEPYSFRHASEDIKALCTESGLNQTGSYLSDEEAKLVKDILTTAIDLEKDGHQVYPHKSIFQQKESIDLMKTLQNDLSEPKVDSQVEDKSAKDKYLEDFARQNQGASRTKSGSMKI